MERNGKNGGLSAGVDKKWVKWVIIKSVLSVCECKIALTELL